MTLILDSGGVSALSTDQARLAELRRRGLWPPVVPVVVLVESLSGDPRRDFHTNRFLRTCEVRAVDEMQCRDAATLRAATGRAGKISAIDALVVAFALSYPDPIVVTSDPVDIGALAAQAARPVRIVVT